MRGTLDDRFAVKPYKNVRENDQSTVGRSRKLNHYLFNPGWILDRALDQLSAEFGSDGLRGMYEQRGRGCAIRIEHHTNA